MVEAHSAPRWDGIREMIRDPLATLVQQLQTRLGENLRGVIVVGSALTDDFQPNASDINTVVLLNRHDVGTLNAVASLGRSLSRRRLSAPLLMTSFHIERSRDVFGVEFLDFQRTHETILGEDPFAAIHVEKSDVRLQCERELKAMLVACARNLNRRPASSTSFSPSTRPAACPSSSSPSSCSTSGNSAKRARTTAFCSRWP